MSHFDQQEAEDDQLRRAAESERRKRVSGGKLPPNVPCTLPDLLWYVKEYERDIFVRVRRDGGFANLSLAELTPRELSEKLAGFIENGIIPVRVRRDSKMTSD